MVWIMYGAQFEDDSPLRDRFSHPDWILNSPAAVEKKVGPGSQFLYIKILYKKIHSGFKDLETPNTIQLRQTVNKPFCGAGLHSNPRA